MDEDRLDANRSHWDELADLHPKTEFYDLDTFLAGESSLDSVELEGILPVENRSILHLQCRCRTTDRRTTRVSIRPIRAVSREDA